jgi:hypothetical protein
MAATGAKMEHVLRVYLTPKDLREMATKMEETWAGLAAPQNAIVKEWDGVYGSSVVFQFDSVRMTRDFGPCGKNHTKTPPLSKDPPLPAESKTAEETSATESSTAKAKKKYRPANAEL